MSTPPVTVSLMGGLGNQLFQLAAGLEVAARAHTSLRLDLSWFDQRLRRSRGGLVLRPYALQGIADDLPALTSPHSRWGEVSGHAADVPLRRGGRLANRLPLRVHVEMGGGFDPRVLDLGPGSHLRGYYASWRYFPSQGAQMRQRVLAGPQISAWAREAAQEATETGVLALHVRRGDYLSLASTYGHVGPAYYRRAVDAVRRLGTEGRPIWLFSDEPDAARAWLGDAAQVTRVVEPPPATSPLDSLVVMAGASGLVMANSTYSWWAAYLRDHPERPVVAPRPMWASAGGPEERDLLLPDWLTVDCREFA